MADTFDKRAFKKINFDNSPKDFAPGDIAGARNMHIGVTSQGYVGAAEFAMGNTLVPNPNLAPGNNIVVGQHEDKSNGSLFFFCYNDLANHGIYRFYLETNTIEVVKIDSLFNFGKDHFITGIVYLNDLLYFTDYYNQPRKINVAKANDTNKLREASFYFNVNHIKLSGVYYIIILNPDSTPFMTTVFGTPADAHANLFTACKAFMEAYELATPTSFKNAVDVHQTGNYITIKLKPGQEGAYQIYMIADGKVVPQNYYPSPFREVFINAVKNPASAQPNAVYKLDPKRLTNYVQERVFQFKTRITYDDHEKSVTSPISNIPLADVACGDNTSGQKNYIEIDFSDAVLSNQEDISIIKTVEILVREHNTGLFRSVVVLQQADFITDFKYNFYNDGIYMPIAESESNLLYHSMPLKSKSLNIVKNRLFYGGNKSGYDNISIDASVTPIYEAIVNPNLYRVRGTVVVKNLLNNTYSYAGNQPIHDQQDGQGPCFGGLGDYNFQSGVGTDYKQNLPLGGFTLYLAGTPYTGTSKQRQGLDPGLQVNGVYNSSNGDPVLGTGNIGAIQRNMTSHSDGDPLGNNVGSQMWSVFEMNNVPEGTYIIRVASNYTTAADLQDITRHYEKTSTNVLKVAGVSSYEATLIISNGEATINGNPVLKESSNSFYIGETQIADLTGIGYQDTSTALTGYLVDQSGLTQINILNGTHIGLAKATFNMTAATTASSPYNNYVYENNSTKHFAVSGLDPSWMYADHNGYVFFTFGLPVISTKTIDLVTFSVLGYTTGTSLGTNYWKGDNTTAAFVYPSKTTLLDGEMTRLAAINTTANVTNLSRTHLTGYVKDGSSGVPVQGVTVMSRRGEVVETNSEGAFDIIVYADTQTYDATGNKQRQDSVLFQSLDNNCVLAFPQQNISYFVELPPYSNTVKYDMGINLADESGLSINTSYKHGFSGQFGIVYFDDANRSTFVNSNELLKVSTTFSTESDPITGVQNNKGRTTMSWAIRNLAPSWATHYQWYRTTDQALSFFIQFAADSIFPVNDLLATVAFNAATQLKIGIGNITGAYKTQNPKSLLSYVYQPGDRIRFIHDPAGNYFEYQDTAVLSSSGGFIYCAYNNIIGTPGASGGQLFEIYTPVPSTQTSVFYEFGETYSTARDTNGITYHNGQLQNQDPLNPSTSPATGVFKTGDVYLRLRNMPTQAGNILTYVEDPAISDFFLSTDQSIGRPGIINLDAKTTDIPTEVKFSDEFIQDTNINGLSAIQPLSRKQLPDQYGLIHKLVVFGADILIALCGNSKSVSMYIQQALFKDINGQQVVAVADDVIGTVTTLQEEYGTQNAESVVTNNQGHIYFVDRRKRSEVRYAQNGLFPISINKSYTHFDELMGGYVNHTDSEIKIIGGMNKSYLEYTVAFMPIATAPVFAGETICYSEVEEGQTSTWDYAPEYMACINTTLVSFKSGQLYLHDSNELRGNFYGVQYKPSITVLSNADYTQVKAWKALYIEANSLWYCPRAVTESNTMFGGVMQTRMGSGMVRGKEGKWYVEFNRDINTPNSVNPIANGRKMRSQSIFVELTTDSVGESVITEVSVLATISERS